MDRQEFEFLKRMFSDAHVVDVDLSEWDRRLTLCVIADHTEAGIRGRRPVYLVNFDRVHDLGIKFRHLVLQPPEPDVHFQWQVDTSSLDHEARLWRIGLSGLLATPALEIVCEDVNYVQISHRDMDRLLPGWDSPSSGFARPGIAALLEGIRSV